MKIYTKSQAESIIRRAEELERKGKTKKLERLQPWLKAASEHLATGKPVEVEPSALKALGDEYTKAGWKATRAVWTPFLGPAGRAAKRGIADAVAEGTASATSREPTMAEQLSTLADLYARGKLTDAEYREAKQRVLKWHSTDGSTDRKY